MLFRTIVNIKPQHNITYKDKIMMLGSCFAENMGEKLQKAKFRILVNPFGVIYNPESVRISVLRILEEKLFTEDEIFEHEGSWKSFRHHSRFSALTLAHFLENANQKLEEAADFFQNIDILIITFGTAWIYTLKESETVVSNCHKLPASFFSRKRLSVEYIVETYAELIAALLKRRPALQILFTVSPVRHWKDGAHENQVSKAILLLAIEQIRRLFPDNTAYFPAYEIVLDELRDYRFYADDMIHPNETAIGYIWERFSDTFFSAETRKQIAEIEKLLAATQHRPFQPQSKSFQLFVNKNITLLDEIKKKYPELDFEEEKRYWEGMKVR